MASPQQILLLRHARCISKKSKLKTRRLRLRVFYFLQKIKIA
jgi:hypothetical protein